MNKVPVYWRRLIVRAIEDAIILGCLCLGIAGVCLATTKVFEFLGVL